MHRDRWFTTRRTDDGYVIKIFTRDYPLNILSSPGISRYLCNVIHIELLEEEFGDGILWLCDISASEREFFHIQGELFRLDFEEE
jgi:hypothetical protein